MLRWRFIAEKDPLSRTISWWGGGDWSHIDLAMPDGTFAGARLNGGYQIRPADYIKPAKSCVLSLETTPEQEMAYYAASKAKEGAPYDRIAIAGFIVGRNWAQPGAWICSEAQADNAVKAEIIKPLYLSANRITPNDMTLILSAVGATVMA